MTNPLADRLFAARAREAAIDSEIPPHAQRLADDAKDAGHGVEVRHHKINGRRYVEVAITVTEDEGAELPYSAWWKRRDGGWRFWYATDSEGRTVTLRYLRTWVTERRHLIASR